MDFGKIAPVFIYISIKSMVTSVGNIQLNLELDRHFFCSLSPWPSAFLRDPVFPSSVLGWERYSNSLSSRFLSKFVNILKNPRHISNIEKARGLWPY